MILLPRAQCHSASESSGDRPTSVISTVNQLVSSGDRPASVISVVNQLVNIRLLFLSHTTHKIPILNLNSGCKRQNHNTMV